MHVLLTGATGFLGSELLRSLLRDPMTRRVVVLVRAKYGLSAKVRMERLFAHWARFMDLPSHEQLSKIEIVDYDLDAETLPEIQGSIDTIWHAAASTDLGLSLALSRKANVRATQKALRIGRGLKGVQRFMHFSTAYVCGGRRGLIREDDPAPLKFHNFYEQSKREAEDAVRWGGLPYTILRPSIIVGRSDDGYAPSTKVLYSVWRMWLSGLVPRAPVDPAAWVDIVPVDFVVRASLALSRHPCGLGQSFHLCAGDDRLSPKAVLLTAASVFDVAAPPLSPPWVARALRFRVIRPFVKHGLNEVLDAMYWHLPYLGIRDRCFDMERTISVLKEVGVSCPQFSDYGETLFRFCKMTSWGKRPLRKLHEFSGDTRRSLGGTYVQC